MSKISNLIFKNEPHYITSSYGSRSVIQTSAGQTASFHSGTDYGTNNKKIAQYAVEDGYVMDAAVAADGAKYIWMIYPNAKLAMLHYHLDSIAVKAGQKVKKGDKLGTTGMTGKATGIHLHLGVKPLSGVKNINAVTYSVLNGISYVDPEKVTYSETSTAKTKKEETIKTNSSFLPAKGYWDFGDKDEKIGRLASWMRKVFPAYTPAAALGNLYGTNLKGAITQFQTNCKLTGEYKDKVDGKCGPKTLACLKKYGFTE